MTHCLGYALTRGEGGANSTLLLALLHETGVAVAGYLSELRADEGCGVGVAVGFDWFVLHDPLCLVEYG